ncbi:unnamed protein product [Echinostoma caproni]|uniref:UFSP1/2/DUB catalytic domain-containing protein n=1 Tax=Echinostoma caproni TaxID=27848 RepID=A0A3P8GQ36_9TREM|nr:unnamed protein product [Echinostoma caproni]
MVILGESKMAAQCFSQFQTVETITSYGWLSHPSGDRVVNPPPPPTQFVTLYRMVVLRLFVSPLENNSYLFAYSTQNNQRINNCNHHWFIVPLCVVPVFIPFVQDNTDDKNWGCAYRSLQTLISWLMWQGEVPVQRLPSITDIQASLARTGDKPKNFVGSRQWIGSFELSFCLEEMYGIQCRLLPVTQGSQMTSTASVLLSQHFASGGGPVMIGGGQLAHTIIGVQLSDTSVPGAKSAPTRYLILDPHYTGPAGNLKQIVDKGWCGWKEESFWKPTVHYNLCFLPVIRPGRV